MSIKDFFSNMDQSQKQILDTCGSVDNSPIGGIHDTAVSEGKGSQFGINPEKNDIEAIGIDELIIP